MKVTTKDIFSTTHTVDVSELQWRPSAYGIVIKDDKILLSRQFGDAFDLPGGGVDLSEAPDDCVIREVREETGIIAEAPILITVENSYFTATHSDGKSYHCLLFYYGCKAVGGKLGDVQFDEYEQQYAGAPEWMPLDQLDSIKVASTVDWRPIVKGYYANLGD